MRDFSGKLRGNLVIIGLGAKTGKVDDEGEVEVDVDDEDTVKDELVWLLEVHERSFHPVFSSSKVLTQLLMSPPAMPRNRRAASATSRWLFCNGVLFWTAQA
jgi:hypothetical protein